MCVYLCTYTGEEDGCVCAADGMWTKVPWLLAPQLRWTALLWDCMQDWGLSHPERNIGTMPRGAFWAFLVLDVVVSLTLSLGGYHSPWVLSDSHPFLQSLCTGGSLEMACRIMQLKGILGGSAVRSGQVVHDFVWSLLLVISALFPVTSLQALGLLLHPSKPSLALAEQSPAPTASSLWASYQCSPTALALVCPCISCIKTRCSVWMGSNECWDLLAVSAPVAQ